MKEWNDMFIMMLDGCTENEAKKYIRNGSTVFDGDDFENNLERYLDDWNIWQEEEKEKYRNMVSSKEPIEDWGVVSSGELWFYVAYCL